MSKAMHYKDKEGVQWVMSACGHYTGGSVKSGDKIALCPNCRFLAGFQPIDIAYPELLPSDLEVVATKSATEPKEQPMK